MSVGLGFSETMRGEMRDGWGRAHRLEFRVDADSGRALDFIRTGNARLLGLIHAPPWADEAIAEGTIVVRPWRSRTMEYQIRFVDDAGTAFELRGRKRMSGLRPVEGMTRLEAELFTEGVVVARGSLLFSLADLGQFAASWAPHGRIHHTDLGRRTTTGLADQTMSIEASTLSPARERMLHALAEACIAPGVRVPAADQQTHAETMALVADMPRTMRLAYGAGLDALDLLARAETRRGFVELDPTRRRAWLAARASASGGPRTRLVHGLVLPIKVAHFNRRDYLEAGRLPRFDAAHARAESDVPKRLAPRVVTPEAMLEVEDVEAEVVVVGTGAGGAAVAAELAERGVAVAMVEAGRYVPRSEFRGSPVDRSRRLWSDRGMQLSIGNAVASIPTGRAVGGTTLINSGTCYRTPDAVLEEWLARGFPADFRPQQFSTWLDRVERELQVEPGDASHLGRVADTVARGAEALGLEHGPLPRNAPGCDGQGTCIYGCPTGAKRSTNVSWVPRALRAGAMLYTGMRLQTVLRRGRRIHGVIARGQSPSGEPRTLRIRARAVILACGSLRTPGLLRAAGVDLPGLGRGLSIHPGLGMYARNDDASTPWNAIPQGYGAWGHGLEGVRLEGFYLPPQMAAAALLAVGDELTHWMDDPAKVDQFGFMVRDENDGQVLQGPHGPVVRKDFGPRTVSRLRGGAALLAELLLRGGAKEVFTGIAGIGAVGSVDEARAIASAPLRAQDFTVLGAHPLATCAMGPNAERAVVDFEHRVYGTENLFVVDGASVPSSLGVNPQMTIMAMALRAGEILANGLSAA